MLIFSGLVGGEIWLKLRVFVISKKLALCHGWFLLPGQIGLARQTQLWASEQTAQVHVLASRLTWDRFMSRPNQNGNPKGSIHLARQTCLLILLWITVDDE